MIAGEQDASEVEGAMKKKDVQYQAKKGPAPDADADNKPAPSKTAKSSWGVEGQKAAKADSETPLQTDFEYNFDEPDEEPLPKGDEDDELSTQVAEPPKLLTNKVQTMKELESLAKFNLPQAKESGIDIALLTNTLAPQYQVHERDELWDFEELFLSLSSELDQELQEGIAKEMLLAAHQPAADGERADA